jgi:hypothetical protein
VSRGRLWAFLAIGLPVLAALLAKLESVDLAYHLRAGGMIIDTGRIPVSDTFTFTAVGLPWQDQQWAAEAAFALIYRAAGWTGLAMLRAALVGIVFALVFAMCRPGNSARTAALITIASFGLAIVTLSLRPQLFGMVLFTFTLWLTSRRHEHPRSFWLTVPLTIAWASLHGSFFLGPAIVGLAAVEDWLTPVTRRHAIRTAALSALAAASTLLNPFGIDVWRYALGIATNSVIASRVSEWQLTTPLSIEGAAFYASVIVISAALVWSTRSGRRLDRSLLLWLAPFALIGFRTVRGLAWWPIVAAWIAARLLATESKGAATEPTDPPLARRANVIIAGVLVLAGVALLPAWRPVDPGLAAPIGVVGTAPSGITTALRSLVQPDDRVFAPQPWGSWFEFAVPTVRVFVDSRVELFPVRVWSDYDEIAGGGETALVALDRWDVTIVVIADQSASSPLAQLLGSDPAWHEAYHDDDGRVFILK